MQAARIYSMGMYLPESPLDSLESFARWLEPAVSRTRGRSVRKLLVFPEYLCLPLMHSNATARRFHAGFWRLLSELARKESAYLLACALDQDGRNEARLLDPGGAPVLRAYKHALTPSERELGLLEGTGPAIALSTPFGRIATAICNDAFNGPYLDGLVSQGLEILLQPSANPQVWAAAARGSGTWQPLEWARLQAAAFGPNRLSLCLIVNPMLRGEFQGRVFDGQSSIIVRAADPLECPYEGVSERFRMRFVHCGPDREYRDHDVGWIDLWDRSQLVAWQAGNFDS